MKVCKACRDLDGQPHNTPPHDDLALMSSERGASSGFLTMVSWRCVLCDTWMRQHTGYGEQPGTWEALLQINPWFQNGYQVFSEAKKTLGTNVFEGWYQIEVPESPGRMRSVIFTSIHAGTYKTAFAATLAALEAGRHHAMQLSPQPDFAPPQMLTRRPMNVSRNDRGFIRHG